jgi:hypothetical protein
MGSMIKIAAGSHNWKTLKRDAIVRSGAKSGLIGGIGGAVLGNVAGRMTSKGKDEEEKKKHIRSRTAQGALAGGIGGGAYGAIGTNLRANKFEKQYPTHAKHIGYAYKRDKDFIQLFSGQSDRKDVIEKFKKDRKKLRTKFDHKDLMKEFAY